ncbi:hypothetical protein C0Q70_03678 [Pomacea canaliculata]|uniref:Orange domain-containing protein n=1 Tax=Pomacea canaliculata TaxID=400727 RepID=A0A2T7PTE2_POMCA|nr:hypothetical protein C0Q70_03678 [Pomacea canaliculata]
MFQDGQNVEATTVQKATILEATVRYIKTIQRSHGGGHHTQPADVRQQYQHGFSTAIDRIEHYLAKEDGMSDALRLVLKQHLEKMRRDLLGPADSPWNAGPDSSFSTTSNVGAEPAQSIPQLQPLQQQQQPGYPWYPCSDGPFSGAHGSMLDTRLSPIHHQPYVCPTGSPLCAGNSWAAPGRVPAVHPSQNYHSPTWSNVTSAAQLQYTSTPQTPIPVMYPVSVDTRVGSFNPQDSGYGSPSVAISPFYGVDAGAPAFPPASSPCSLGGVLNLSKRRRLDHSSPVPAHSTSSARDEHPTSAGGDCTSSGLAAAAGKMSSSATPSGRRRDDNDINSKVVDMCANSVSPEDVEIAQIMGKVDDPDRDCLPCSSMFVAPELPAAWVSPPADKASRSNSAAAPAFSSPLLSAAEKASDPHKLAASADEGRPASYRSAQISMLAWTKLARNMELRTGILPTYGKHDLEGKSVDG